MTRGRALDIRHPSTAAVQLPLETKLPIMPLPSVMLQIPPLQLSSAYLSEVCGEMCKQL